MSRTRIVNNLPQFLDSVDRKAARAVMSAVIIGAADAAAMTPRDTSNLINSQTRDVSKQGNRIVGRVGYTAEYALAVHEAKGTLKGQPRPKRDGKARGNYWGPSGEPAFLRQGFERSRPLIEDAIKRIMKV